MKIEWDITHLGPSEEIVKLIQLGADSALEAEGVLLPCAIGVHMVTKQEIKALNQQYRNINKSTDVLSFPMVNYPRGKTAKQTPKALSRNFDDELKAIMLGDLFLCVDHIESQAKEFGHSFAREAAYLCVHGVFHLLGYDHMKEDEKKEMRMMEEKALGLMGQGRENPESPVSDEQLLALARQAMEKSYAPYSGYPVGASLLSTDGRVFLGCNVENASFGLSNCGERTAVFKAISEGCTEFEAIAIASKKSAPWPCGACRQVLNEFAPNIRVLVTWGEGEVAQSTLKELLPHGFGPKDLI